MAVDDSYTKLLLHCDGANGSQTFIDESGKTVTTIGTAQISTAQQVFGTGSMLLDGNSDYVQMDNSADFNFGSGDFTFDFRWRPVALTGAPYFWFHSQPSGPYGGFAIRLTSTGKLELWNYVDPNYECYFQTTSAPSFSNGTWYHIAFVRYGTSGKFYIGGTYEPTTVINAFPAGALTNINNKAFIGAWYQPGVDGPRYWLNAYIDEFRLSKGIARWTSNFTPPTSAYAPASTTLRHQIITC